MSNVSINVVRLPNPNTQSIKLKETINLLALKNIESDLETDKFSCLLLLIGWNYISCVLPAPALINGTSFYQNIILSEFKSKSIIKVFRKHQKSIQGACEVRSELKNLCLVLAAVLSVERRSV